MARSNKPLVWSLFAAGGTLAAFVLPALVLVTMRAGYGHVPAPLSYENMHAFASGWLGKALILGVIALCLFELISVFADRHAAKLPDLDLVTI